MVGLTAEIKLRFQISAFELKFYILFFFSVGPGRAGNELSGGFLFRHISRIQNYLSQTWHEELDCDIVLALCRFSDCLILFAPRLNKIPIAHTKNNASPTATQIAAISMVESLPVAPEKINKHEERLFNICFIKCRF